jgi:hypothetical protein
MVLGLRGKHQDRFYLKGIRETIYTRQNIYWWVRPQAYLRIISTHKQLTTHGQSLAANLASLEAMVEPVLNDDHARVKFEKSFK